MRQPLPENRKRAKALSASKYFTGKACKRGHISSRYTGSGLCVECNSEHSKSPESLEAKLRYARKDPEAHNRRGREHYARNLEKERLRSKNYRLANPKIELARQVRRRASKLKATPSWLTDQHKAEIRQIYETSSNLSVDHIVPLVSNKVCGLHVPWNLRHLPKLDNSIKGNKLNPALAIDYEAPGWKNL